MSSATISLEFIAPTSSLLLNLSRIQKQEGKRRSYLRYLHVITYGSFSCHPFGSEQDMRFIYCACAISHLLDDWDGVDKAGVLRFIESSQAFDGAIGIAPGNEGQGGATYCAIGALSLCGKLAEFRGTRDLLQWLVFRQQNGFQGRCNKLPDSCYAFWDGAALDLLGLHQLVDVPSCHTFVLSCESSYGGFSKFPGEYPDLLHSYYSLAWLSIAQVEDLAQLDSKLQVVECKNLGSRVCN